MIANFVSRRLFMCLSVFWPHGNWIMACFSIDACCGAFVLYLCDEKSAHCRLEVIYPFVLHKYYQLVDVLLVLELKCELLTH